jgi:hypothetical protein
MSEGGEARNHEAEVEAVIPTRAVDAALNTLATYRRQGGEFGAMQRALAAALPFLDAVRRSPQGEEPEVIPWPRELGVQPDGEVAVRYPNGQTGVRPKMSPDKLRSPQGENHEHEWVDARNGVVESGEVCLGCGAVRPTPERTA